MKIKNLPYTKNHKFVLSSPHFSGNHFSEKSPSKNNLQNGLAFGVGVGLGMQLINFLTAPLRSIIYDLSVSVGYPISKQLISSLRKRLVISSNDRSKTLDNI
jgi:Na+-translocating ferredoxin:NAD+ oxidoreductase RnfA subunit